MRLPYKFYYPVTFPRENTAGTIYYRNLANMDAITSQRLRVFKITFYIKYLALNVYYLLKIHVTVKLLHEVLSHPYPIRQNNKYNAYIPWIYRTFPGRILHASRIYTKNFQKVQGDCAGYRKFCISRSRLRQM